MQRLYLSKLLWVAGLFFLFGAAALAADEPVTEKLTIERVYSDPSLSGPTPRGLRLSPDGKLLTFLRGKTDDYLQQDLWAMSTNGGKPYLLVDSKILSPETVELSEEEKGRRERQRIRSRGIVQYNWNKAGTSILVPLDGDIYTVSIPDNQVRRITETAAFETDVKFSPKGNFISYVRARNLFVFDLATNTERAITKDGGDTISNGMAEFVAQEEMDRDTGYWWSPNELFLAFQRTDESQVEIINRMEISATSARIVPQRYPRAGMQNVTFTLNVMALKTAQQTQIDLGENPDIYLVRVNWDADSKGVLVQRQNREQTQLDLLRADPITGTSQVILSQSAKTWINLSRDLRQVQKGKQFLWTSEQSGFRHLYLYNKDGSLVRQITHGNWPVSSIVGIDKKKGLVYFTGWQKTPLENHLFVVSYKKPNAKTRQITKDGGSWSVNMDSKATRFIGRYSDPDTPPQTALYTVKGKRVAWVEENRLAEGHPYFAYSSAHITPEFGTIKASDGTKLHYQIYKPANFDPSRKYPAIINVYAGPGTHLVRRSWRGGGDQLYPQAGYVYFRLDSRGSNNRGKAFEDSIFRAMAGVEVEDQLAGLKFLRSLDFVDAKRVGIHGWSYGGYMTLMLTLRAPEPFAASIAGAPVSDWSLYDTHYTERFMGTPQNNAKGYQASSVLSYVDNLRSPLLMIHGMADDNVIFANSTQVYAAFQAKNLPFEMMTYPGQRHGVRGKQQRKHLTHAFFSFFERQLKE
ncbi:Dipeptidyl peptidase IV [hydrothermal vent metagenome]|uniref:Dipeptidyl peptidase IV n=1 Tax=hydrothermal vent metagenome TaxID=652676 RepID=A0A3B0R4I4_9ZZZZ